MSNYRKNQVLVSSELKFYIYFYEAMLDNLERIHLLKEARWSNIVLTNSARYDAYDNKRFIGQGNYIALRQDKIDDMDEPTSIEIEQFMKDSKNYCSYIEPIRSYDDNRPTVK